jgi:thiosulfate dehydrogenase
LLRLGFLTALMTACRVEERPPRTSGSGVEPTSGVGVDTAVPNTPIGIAIRRGRALMAATRDSLPRHVNSDLRCFSCHLANGTQPGAIPFTGVYSRFPQYRSRNGLINLLEDRINDCFERSMNGKAIPRDGADMRAIVAYLAYVSRGVAPPGDIPGIGVVELPVLTPDTARGRLVFAETCVRCHGANGAGTALAPPLWGPRSFNIGAGMARLRTAAAFIRVNMPNDRAVTLTDQQANDVAAYVVARPRPDFAGKARDWPHGDPPPDVAYRTRAGNRKVVPRGTP